MNTKSGFSIVWLYATWLAVLGGAVWVGLKDSPLKGLVLLGATLALGVGLRLLAPKLAPLLSVGELRDQPPSEMAAVVGPRTVTLYSAYG